MYINAIWLLTPILWVIGMVLGRLIALTIAEEWEYRWRRNFVLAQVVIWPLVVVGSVAFMLAELIGIIVGGVFFRILDFIRAHCA